MKGKMLAVAVAVAVAAVGLFAITAGTASAGQAVHFKTSFSGKHRFPAGTICNFTYRQTFTATLIGTISPKAGIEVDKLTVLVTHTNVDTGYTLTEVDQNASIGPQDSAPSMTVGIFWHLRDASGKIVLVNAGKATFDPTTGDLISFTPNSGFDKSFAETICPLLGGSPA
jgi:hypothetical protein